MIFSIPKSKPVPQIQTQSVQNKPNNIISGQFINIFSRIEKSGSCKSCG